nr:reverse transcriptase domain-containing protein [Tanacetum cinerariifolium]
KLVSFDEGQVVTFNGEFVCGFRNGDGETESWSDNTVTSPYGFIIHWVVIFKNIKKVTKKVDVKNGIGVINEILEEDFDSLFDEGSSILYSIKGTLLEDKLFAEFDEFMAMNVEEDIELDNEEATFEKNHL